MINVIEALFPLDSVSWWAEIAARGKRCTFTYFSLLPTARVCDNILLRCQNGGVCHHHQRCQCPAGFTGVLCEKSQCQGDSCDELQSSQPALHQTSLPLVIVSLISTLLVTRGLQSLWEKHSSPRDIVHRDPHLPVRGHKLHCWKESTYFWKTTKFSTESYIK